MTWLSIIIAGILTYFTRMTMIALVDRDMLGEKIKAVLALSLIHISDPRDVEESRMPSSA